MSSGLTALQGTVASLQTAIANIPVTPATDVSGLATAANLAALDTALTALAAEVDALTTALANAATSAEVAALQTALTAAQGDLSDLLAANNVYSTALVIDSPATLAFAKSLGDKLTIVNADVTFIVDDTMSAADVQLVADKLVTVTKNLTFHAKTSAVTAIDFSNLTSVTDLTFTQAGSYNLGKLTNAGAIKLGNNYSTKVNVIDLEALTTVTSLNTGSAALSGSTVTFTSTVNTIDFNRATNIHLTALAVYTPGALTLKGGKDFTLKIDALTSQDAEGEEVGLNLTIDGAASLNNDKLVSGDVNTTGVSTVILKKLTSADAGTVGNAVTLELGALEGDLEVSGSDLETATIVSILDADASTADKIGGDITLSATSLLSATISGVPDAISFDGASDLEDVTISGSASSIYFNNNSSLTDVAITSAVTGKVTVNNADDLLALDLAHTVAAGATVTSGSLVVTNNAKLASLKADKVNKLGLLTITGNEDLSTVSFAALAAINTGDGKPSVTIGGTAPTDKNNMSASKIEDTVEAAGVIVDEGKITTASGITALKGYLDLAIAGKGTVYVAFDTVDLHITEADFETSNITSGAKLVVIDVAPNTADTGDDAIAEIKAYRINPANPVQISVGGSNFYASAITPGLNTTLAVAALKSTEAMAVADAAKVTFNAVAGAGATTTVKFLTTASATLGEAYAGTAHSSTTVLAADDYVTLTINSQSVSSTATHASATSTIGIASALATAWMTKYGSTSVTSKTASLFDVDADTTSGSIIVTAKAGSGYRGNDKPVSVTVNTGTSTATTPIIDYVIGATRLSTDNKTIGTGIVLTFENDIAGTIVPMPRIGITSTGSTSLSTTEYFNKTTVLNDANTVSNIHPTEARGIARNAEDSNSAATSNARTTDYTSWL